MDDRQEVPTVMSRQQTNCSQLADVFHGFRVSIRRHARRSTLGRARGRVATVGETSSGETSSDGDLTARLCNLVGRSPNFTTVSGERTKATNFPPTWLASSIVWI